MSAVILRGDARKLPLPDDSVDLIVTSPPYWALRSYSDNGEHYAGQIGSEETSSEWLAALWECTREWVRVLKPEGSLFVNLGDKFGDRGHGPNRGLGTGRGPQATHLPQTRGPMEKSLLGLPWRYAIGCIDRLGLILREDNIWSKVNPLPSSATDRCARSHEYLFHFTRQCQYYSALDEIREPHTMKPQRRPNGHKQRQQLGTLPAQTYSTSQRDEKGVDGHRLGKAPGSVWEIASQPLIVPDRIVHARCCGGRKRPGCEDGLTHHAAFPMALPRQCILGWSPAGICTACREGRRPVIIATQDRQGRTTNGPQSTARRFESPGRDVRTVRETTIIGYACACTPYTDHPGTGEPSGPYGRHAAAVEAGTYENVGADWGGKGGLGDRPRVGPWREYHFDQWDPAPTRPAVILDPFSGTGTTLLAAAALGRHAIGGDRSADYCRLAQWRTTDPAERAKAMQVPKPPPVIDGQGDLFSLEAS